MVKLFFYLSPVSPKGEKQFALYRKSHDEVDSRFDKVEAGRLALYRINYDEVDSCFDTVEAGLFALGRKIYDEDLFSACRIGVLKPIC